MLFYLVVGVVSAHSDGVHNKLAPFVITGGAVLDVAWVVLRTKVVPQLMSGHQVCFLQGRKS